MKYLRLLCLLCCLGSLLPLTTTLAEFNAEAIFVPNTDDEKSEIWITNVQNTRHARKIYTHPFGIYTVAAQPDGDFIVFVSDAPVPFFAFDAYIIDRRRLRAGARDLTKLRFDEIVSVDISKNGDVVFTNADTALHQGIKYGVYLIRSHDLKNATPKAELLVERESYHARWSPDGRHIAFESVNKVMIHDVKTGATSGIDTGHDPVFAPDGNRLAFFHEVWAQEVAISIVSRHPRRHVKTIALDAERDISNLDWTPDGESLVYTEVDGSYRTYVVPLDGSPREEILKLGDEGAQHFDWTRTAYPVEPTKKLTTLWGALKTDNTHRDHR